MCLMRNQFVLSDLLNFSTKICFTNTGRYVVEETEVCSGANFKEEQYYFKPEYSNENSAMETYLHGWKS